MDVAYQECFYRLPPKGASPLHHQEADAGRELSYLHALHQGVRRGEASGHSYSIADTLRHYLL